MLKENYKYNVEEWMKNMSHLSANNFVIVVIYFP